MKTKLLCFFMALAFLLSACSKNVLHQDEAGSEMGVPVTKAAGSCGCFVEVITESMFYEFGTEFTVNGNPTVAIADGII